MSGVPIEGGGNAIGSLATPVYISDSRERAGLDARLSPMYTWQAVSATASTSEQPRLGPAPPLTPDQIRQRSPRI